MKIGIISDTHGNIPATTRASTVFVREKVKAIFHCGDIGSFDVLSELTGLDIPIHAVMGNVDTYSSDLKFFPTDLGIQLYGRFGAIEIDGLRIALLHSDDRARYSQTISSGEYDYVFLDCPPNITLVSVNIFYASDLILVPVIPTTLSYRTLENLLTFFKKEKLGLKKILPFFSQGHPSPYEDMKLLKIPLQFRCFH